MKNGLIILFFTLLFTSCTDYVTSVSIEFKNDSSHEITFVQVYNKTIENDVVTQYGREDKYTLNVGETLTLHKSDMGSEKLSVLALWMQESISSLQYGDKVEIELSDTKLLEDSTCEKVVSKKRVQKYSYTFTDADYQFALENGTKVEN